MTGHVRLLVAAGLACSFAVGCGCETAVRISHVRGAGLEVPASVRRLAVVVFSCDSVTPPGPGRALCNDLAALLADPPGRYDLVSLASPALPGSPLGPGEARRLAKRENADAVLYGSITVAVSKTASPRPETSDPTRSKIDSAVGEVVDCRVSVRFAMDEVASGRTIASVLLTKSDRVTDGPPGAGDRTVRDLLRRCSAEFVRMIGPPRVDFMVVLDASDVTIIARGNALARDKKYAEALDCYTAALAREPGDAAAAFNAGVMYERQRRCVEALAMYDRAFALVAMEKYDRARRRVSDRANNND